MAFPTVLEI
uniref:Uncharacterized protein n=1 Tax=Meloidogyne hapla TaxID=6305 RepID=A0A1I8BAG9_MELHA